jgi:Ca2+-binding RTX toxin-like protein
MPGRTIFGTDGRNVLNGTEPWGDTIFGYGGDDDLFGHGGDDWLKGGGGSDILDGGEGSDTADYGESFAGVFINLLTSTPSASGGDAEGDILVSIENLTGSAHRDSLYGNNDANTINGRGGDDSLRGNGGMDTLLGGTGNDRLHGGSGADTLNGGDGIDTADYFLNSPGGVVNLRTGVGPGGDTLVEIENVDGSTGEDTLIGDGNANTLRGLWATDRLEGWGGDDVLDGGVGIDTLVGGIDNDTYIVDQSGDTIRELAGQGMDEVRVNDYGVRDPRSYTLTAGADIETLRTVNDDGTAAINLTGNAIASQQIIGNDGDNVLDGGGGVDRLTGRRGNDTYIVDGNSDTVTERSGEGVDTVLARASYPLTAGADVETLATIDDRGTAAIDLTGNASGNSVRGNDGRNVLNGGDGRDDLTGLGGDDWFRFDTAPSATNIDLIADLNVAGNDTIVLDDLIFGAFATGPLAAERFVTTAPLQDNDNIIYDADGTIYGAGRGALFYDRDGNGTATAVQFATVTPGTVVTHEDFLVM